MEIKYIILKGFIKEFQSLKMHFYKNIIKYKL